ncbi:MAG: FHA domain-containing protein FhaB [Planctomycetes bacterium ADurb.Bin401]|nr:MAG: FHA domain-containing protein FhaB [Planctomycetes bacterium ADurb.Bin401]
MIYVIRVKNKGGEMESSIHLVVRRNEQTVSEFTFAEGNPILIGRRPDLQVVLADNAVSRQHAKIGTEAGNWTIEDLDSANRTYLNGFAIHKAPLKQGDILKIADFALTINISSKLDNIKLSADDTVSLEAASLSTPRDEVIVRKPDASHAPALRLAARRLTDFALAVEALGSASNLDEFVQLLLKTCIQQFTAFRVWCGIRSGKTGPITFQAGKRRDGKSVLLTEIRLGPKVNETFERGQSLVLPQVAAKLETTERIRSAMISSIKTPSGCFGVIYIDNAMVHEHYSLSDLDYLMILAMHAAAVIKPHL